MSRGSGFRAGWIAALVTAMLASGCQSPGGAVLFAEPEGGSVRIGNGFAHTIPWETHLGIGEHSVVLSPHGRTGFLGLSSGEDAVKGWIVVLESWEGGAAEFAPTSWDLKAAAGSEMSLSGRTPEGLTAFRFKGSTAGIPGDDWEVADWSARAEESLAAMPSSGFVEGLKAVGGVTLDFFVLLFLFWLELEDDDADEEECY